MAKKQPKRPNNNAKTLENWEGEGGAPASDNYSTKRKRSRDLNQRAKRMVGAVEDRPGETSARAKIGAKEGAVRPSRLTHIEVKGEELVVTMTGSTFRVVYRKPNLGPGLVARLDYFEDEQKGPITRAEFLARAWKLATDKARELGWIV